MSEPPENSTYPLDRAEWRAWLEAHHDRDDGVWLVRNKKAAGTPTVSENEAIEEALCFGWIDSRPRALDAERTMLYFAPRKPGSGWSRPNKERIARMTAAGKMTPPGQAKIDAARADGSWSALDDVENLVVPDDLAAAFEEHGSAAEQWEAFPRSAKRGILEWISTAKRETTRARRVEQTARLAAQGERANQWPRS